MDKGKTRTVLPSPLFLEGWSAFNCRKWNVSEERLSWGGDSPETAALSFVLFRDRQGRLVYPPRSPYLPISFKPSKTTLLHRLNRQWLDLADHLVQEMCRRRLVNTMVLPPEITDLRPWQWAGFQVGVRYTYYLDFPFTLSCTDNSVRTDINKATKLGYRGERTLHLEHVLACLKDTEIRQGFLHELSLQDLRMGRDLMGEEAFRTYTVYAPDGEPAGACIVLHHPGTRALFWVAGTKAAHLTSRSAQLMLKTVLDDLQLVGARGLDLVGANLPNVAYAKANWGGRLVPYYAVQGYGVRPLARWGLEWLRFTRRRGES